jgi:hypothetical protein
LIFSIRDFGKAACQQRQLYHRKANVYFQQGEYDLVNYQAFLALYIDPTTEVAYELRVRRHLLTTIRVRQC